MIVFSQLLLLRVPMRISRVLLFLLPFLNGRFIGRVSCVVNNGEGHFIPLPRTGRLYGVERKFERGFFLLPISSSREMFFVFISWRILDDFFCLCLLSSLLLVVVLLDFAREGRKGQQKDDLVCYGESESGDARSLRFLSLLIAN